MAGLAGCGSVCERTPSEAGAGRPGCRGAVGAGEANAVGESNVGELDRALSVDVLILRLSSNGEVTGGTGEEPNTAFSR